MDKPLFVLDSSLPYLEGLVEQVADVRRLPNLLAGTAVFKIARG